MFAHINEKCRLPLKLIYAGGVRITECAWLPVKDRDFGNPMRVVRSGKDDRNRTALLPDFRHDPPGVKSPADF